MSKRSPQLSLEFRRHGQAAGSGRGPGRPVGLNPDVRHRSRERFPSRFPCHVTVKVRTGVTSLRSGDLVKALEKSFANGCERPGFRLVHYSLQRDHAHFLVEANGREALGRGMKSLGSRLARAVNRASGRRGPVLRDRYHLHVLRSPREVRNALRYVLLDARRHAKRPSTELRIDPASSGCWFDGWKHRPLVPLDGSPVARARTWLLGSGWRRYGRIDALEVPG